MSGTAKIIDTEIVTEQEDRSSFLVAPESATPSALLVMSIQQGASLDQLEKLMDLQERYEKNEARKAFTVAMAAFKANPPQIVKDKLVSYGNTHYNHASLGNVTSTINAALGEHGLSAGWTVVQDGGGITVTCAVTHVDGHRESTSLTAPPDNSGKKNVIQAIGSTVTYLQRYTILAITGLATSEQDDDGGAYGGGHEHQQDNRPPAQENTPAKTKTSADYEILLEKATTVEELESIRDRIRIEVKALPKAEAEKALGYYREFKTVLEEKTSDGKLNIDL